MMIPNLSEADIRAGAAPESFSRGLDYYQRGAVGDLWLRGDTLQAEVEGSQYSPYRVQVSFDQGEVAAAECTCPYDWGGWCKHIVAVLLKALHEHERIESRPTIEALLSELDRAQLQALLIGLAERDADLADKIERQITLLRLANAAPQSQSSGAPLRRTAIDQEAIRQQVRFAMRSARRDRYRDYDYYHDEEDPADEIVGGVRPLLEQARRFVEGGDPASALDILEAATDEYLDGCRSLGDEYEEVYGLSLADGAAGEFLGELAEAWAEAFLSAELDQDERDAWGETIAGLHDDANDLGMSAAFDLALTAADQGWEYPPLQRVLAGTITDKGAWETEPPDYADDLALIRLRILERQGRYQEYLYLAEAEGHIDRYVVMLAKMGRTEEAVAEGTQYLTAPNDVLEVAKVLRERGELESALRLAEHGLEVKPVQTLAVQTLDGYSFYNTGHQKAELASWTAELAASMGQRDRALRAAEAAFRAAPNLSAYLKAQELAGERWSDVRPGLLDQLRQSHASDAKVDIFLHEALIDDAIAAVTDGYSYGLLERVTDAAIPTRPAWVIKAATAQAERIMDAGDAQHYIHAVNWLRRARDAYRQAGQIDDWRGYLNSVRTKHGRKYKLMGLLDNI